MATPIGNYLFGHLIPCHPVIRETDVVRGYRWGDTRKRALLAWETANQFCELRV